MARAFFDDPVAGYLFPSAEHRLDGMRRFFGLQLRRSYLPRGEIWGAGGTGGVAGGEMVGAALWLPPAALVPRPGDAFWPLLLIGVFGARLGAARRLGRLLAGRHPSSAHWYLGTIGVEPTRQRRGVGTRLLAPVLHRCDAEQVGAYLECSRRDNVCFYARLGFELREEVEVPGGPKLWLMWRPPRCEGGGAPPLLLDA